MAGSIDVLRRFRDDWLLTTGVGTMAVDSYYNLSPPLADVVARTPALAALIRVLLIPVVALVGLWMALPLPCSVLLALFALVVARRCVRRFRAARGAVDSLSA